MSGFLFEEGWYFFGLEGVEWLSPYFSFLGMFATPGKRAAVPPLDDITESSTEEITKISSIHARRLVHINFQCNTSCRHYCIAPLINCHTRVMDQSIT